MSAWYRADESAPQAFSYIQRQAKTRLDAYKQAQGIYRILYPGEVELNSTGMAQTHYSRRPIMDDHAGMVSRWLDQDALVAAARAPIHENQFFNFKSGQMQDMERMGIVKRFKNTSDSFYPKVNNNYISEWYFDLQNPAQSGPVAFYRRHAGYLTDDKGVAIKSTDTSLPLRYQEKYFAQDDTFTVIEVDQKGNYLLRTAQASTDGYKLDVVNGNYTLNVAKDYIGSITEDYSMSVDGNWQTIVTKDGKFECANYTATISGDTKWDTNGWSLAADGDVKASATGNVSWTADGKMTVSGTAQSTFGDSGSVTFINGTIVQIGGGGQLAAVVTSTSIGVGNMGKPVISQVVTGAKKTFVS